jgi:hypothetical protein
MKGYNLSDKLLYFLNEKRGKYKLKLNSLTCLEDDLKITGDDALEFLEDYSKQFNVNINDVDFSQYFLSENSMKMHLLVVFGIRSGKKKITLGQLDHAINSGQLSKVLDN